MDSAAAARPPDPARKPRLMRRLMCRILGHQWRFLHARDDGGKVHRCQRCGLEAVFVR
ncbi:MAG: hypothetical protein K6T56_09390 [Burkholderiales bacterium]|nr:hypothetical protein [Burkholderiales bacterium]